MNHSELGSDGGGGGEVNRQVSYNVNKVTYSNQSFLLTLTGRDMYQATLQLNQSQLPILWLMVDQTMRRFFSNQ